MGPSQEFIKTKLNKILQVKPKVKIKSRRLPSYDGFRNLHPNNLSETKFHSNTPLPVRVNDMTY